MLSENWDNMLNAIPHRVVESYLDERLAKALWIAVGVELRCYVIDRKIIRCPCNCGNWYLLIEGNVARTMLETDGLLRDIKSQFN